MNTPNLTSLLSSVRNHYYQQKPIIDQNYINNIILKIDDHPIISFDIFDTILTRLFECPIDLFAYVEGKLSEQGYEFSGFGQLRIQAEQLARDIAWQSECREEITLDDIYDALSSLASVSNDIVNQAKICELATELECIVPSVDNEYLLKKLKQQGKKIIFVSDMYLPYSFIKKLLQNINLDVCDHLYLSSELMQTKGSGKIWSTILKNHPNQKILHIGDNEYSDIIFPKKYNITTYKYIRLICHKRTGAQLSPDIIPFSLMSRMHFLMQNLDNTENNLIKFWQGLGNTLGAFILQSFVEWLSIQVQNNKIEHIYFCARDAQIIQKVWKNFHYDVKCQTTSSYLYLSRQVLRFTTCYIELVEQGKLSDTSLTFLVNESVQRGDSYLTWITRLGITPEQIKKTNFSRKFGSLDIEVDFNRLDELKKFIQQKLITILTPVFLSKYEASINYYQQEGLFDPEKKAAIVDLGWGGTIQMSLTTFLEHMKVNKKLYGYYYGLFNHNAPGRIYKNGPMKAAFFNMFLRSDEQFLIENSINILENLHSANHETTIGFIKDKISNQYIPLLKEDTNQEYITYFNKNFKLFQEGIFETLEYWQAKKSVYGINSEWIKPENTLAAILQVCISPNPQEQKFLGNIRHAAIADHSKFYFLINPNLPKKIDEVAKLLHLGGWPCGVMSSWHNRKSEINENIYIEATNHFQHLPDLIKKTLID